MRHDINPDSLYWLTSSCGRIEIQVPGELLLDLTAQGPVDDAAAYWVEALDWSGVDDAALVEDLEEYGCEWDYSEAHLNRARFLWCAAASVVDNPAACLVE